MKLFFVGILVIILISIFISVSNQTLVEVVKDCKVIELQQQQLIEGTGKSVTTEIRYLVITDKETFICESSILNGKYNNSDIFWRLKKDSTYTFKVAGHPKSFIYDYRNVLEVIK